jgi:hypothetical protein
VPRRLRTGAFALLATAVTLTGCIAIFRTPTAREVEPPSGEIRLIRSAVKAHLRDGSVAVFPRGAEVRPTHVTPLCGRRDAEPCTVFRYDLTRADSAAVRMVELDSVVALESLYNQVNVPVSVLVSVGGSFLTALGIAALAIAIFGSCPTVYAFDDTTAQWVLEAESFSYSIAPRFAMRDVDPLGVQPDADGRLTLEIRNEALETHYIDRLELLAVPHRKGETVAPDPRGVPIAASSLVGPAAAWDRAGRSVRRELQARDRVAFETAPSTLLAAGPGNVRDHIDLTFPVTHPSDSAALVLDLRNSLLSTVLLYDVMLGDQGVGAVDWLGQDLGRAWPAYELAQWYTTELGIDVSVWRNGRFEPAGKIADVGPIAWKRVALILPPTQADSVVVRLSFVADNWRIDRAALGAAAYRPVARSFDPAIVTALDGSALSTARAPLQAADDARVITTPGSGMRVAFAPGRPQEPTTYMLAATGFYSEWIREGGLAGNAEGFEPSDRALTDALARWRNLRTQMEEQFYATRIPVR